jgi:hypothetical protein
MLLMEHILVGTVHPSEGRQKRQEERMVKERETLMEKLVEAGLKYTQVDSKWPRDDLYWLDGNCI